MFFCDCVFHLIILPTEILRLLFTEKKGSEFLEYITCFSPPESSNESMATPCP